MRLEQIRTTVSAFRSSRATPDKRSLIMRRNGLAFEYVDFAGGIRRQPSRAAVPADKINIGSFSLLA